MSAVSQSYPNYLGGLNEQPDELKKPGQLVKAINVIPDPVYGLVRRPGFKLIPFTDRDGDELEGDDTAKHGKVGIDPEGTWFEFQLSNTVNKDTMYFGCVNQDGSIVVFDQGGQVQKILYSRDPLVPHKEYVYNSGELKVLGYNKEVIEKIKVETPTDPDINPDTVEYFENSADEPLKYCVSKKHIIFTRPTKTPTLAGVQLPSDDDKNRYYSFVNIKVRDTANYRYNLEIFFPDEGKETYRYMSECEVAALGGEGDPDWDEDESLALERLGPWRFEVDDDDIDGITEPAIIEVSFKARAYSVTRSNGTRYVNRVDYTPDRVDIIYGGKGVESKSFTKKISEATNATQEIKDRAELRIKFKPDTEKRTATKSKPILAPDNIDDITVEILLERLREAIDAELSLNGRVVQVGTGLYVEDTEPFSIATSESAVVDVLNSQKIEDKDIVPIVRVNTVAELPVECYAGFVAQVSNSFDGENDFYLQYKSESESSEDDVEKTKSDGFWEEIAKPFEPIKPNPSQMPHMITIVRETDRDEFVFIVSPIEWAKRTAGTAKDNPSFFTDEADITELNYYKNRLFMMTRAGTIVSSRAGEINNLFINTAVKTSDIDPIDVVANSNQRMPIHGSAVVNNAMVLFGDTEQYSVTTNNDLLTSESVNITRLSNYTFEQKSRPVYLGTSLGFISSGLSRFYEMTNVYDRGPVDINERSQQVQTDFGRGFNMPVSSREQSSMLVYKNYRDDDPGDNSKEMYLYRFRQENSQEKSQTSWVKWELDKPITYVSMPQDKIYVVVTTDDKKQVCSFYVMDSGSADGLPATSLGDAALVPRYLDGWYYDDNNKLQGADYTTTIEFPTIFAMSKGLNPKTDINANLTIHRVKLSTAAVGMYDVKIERKGYDTHELLIEQSPANQYAGGFPRLTGEVIETIPIYTRNHNLTLTITSEYQAPFGLRSMTWEGDYNRPYYKSV